MIGKKEYFIEIKKYPINFFSLSKKKYIKNEKKEMIENCPELNNCI